MMDLTFALVISIPLILILAALGFLPAYLAKQNQKTFDLLKENQDLMRLQIENQRKKESDKTIIGMKLQAFERMTLFLERINLSNLLKRVSQPGQNSGNLHTTLLQSIREEYEHNMSQQLYISDPTWELIKTAKEEVTRVINVAASNVKAEENASVLISELLSAKNLSAAIPIDKAMAGLKKDMKDTF